MCWSRYEREHYFEEIEEISIDYYRVNILKI